MRIAVFITIFLALHLLLNFYVGLRAWQALEFVSSVRPYFVAAFIVIVFSYVIGEVLESKAPSLLSDILVWIGAFWFAYMAYFFLSLVVIDIVRLVQHFTHLLPSPTPGDYVRFKFFGGLTLVAFLSVIMIIGYHNATHIHTKSLSFAVDKPAVHDSLRIVAMSDMHLGTIIGRSRLRTMIDSVNALKPDIVLLLGDEIDGSPKPVIAKGLGELFDTIHSTYGVYSITGNHEYIGDAERSVEYLSGHHVHWLRDSAFEVEGVILVGREDRSMRKPDGKGRKEIGELMQGVDLSKPVILMDHQPFRLEEAEHAGVDLQLSGHTHHAQIWPFNYITEKVYELSWGYKMRGKTHYYVSCGVGTWGPPVRIGSYSEIMEITMNFRH